MKRKTYAISLAKIANQDGFYLPHAFYQDNPHLAEASGHIEVISENTLLIRLEPKNLEQEDEEESLMMSLFLDFLTVDDAKNTEKIIPYSEEMSTKIADLLANVAVEET